MNGLNSRNGPGHDDSTVNIDTGNAINTFRVSLRRREMYCGHARLCVCVCAYVRLPVCPRPHAHTIARTRT